MPLVWSGSIPHVMPFHRIATSSLASELESVPAPPSPLAAAAAALVASAYFQMRPMATSHSMSDEMWMIQVGMVSALIGSGAAMSPPSNRLGERKDGRSPSPKRNPECTPKEPPTKVSDAADASDAAAASREEDEEDAASTAAVAVAEAAAVAVAVAVAAASVAVSANAGSAPNPAAPPRAAIGNSKPKAADAAAAAAATLCAVCVAASVGAGSDQENASPLPLPVPLVPLLSPPSAVVAIDGDLGVPSTSSRARRKPRTTRRLVTVSSDSAAPCSQSQSARLTPYAALAKGVD